MNLKIVPCVAFAGVMALVVMGNSSYAGDDTPSPALYSQLEAFHGHVCAGSIIGARLGLAAKEALKEAGGTGTFTARYYDLSCPVDGIQVAAGTTYGNKALTVQERDEHRLVLIASGNKRAVEARLTKKAEELGLKSRDLGKKSQTTDGQLSGETESGTGDGGYLHLAEDRTCWGGGERHPPERNQSEPMTV